MALTAGDMANFETLRDAMLNGDVALLECQCVNTGRPVAAICAVNPGSDQSLDFVPIAQLFSENPYTLLNPPHPDPPGFAS